MVFWEEQAFGGREEVVGATERTWNLPYQGIDIPDIDAQTGPIIRQAYSSRQHLCLFLSYTVYCNNTSDEIVICCTLYSQRHFYTI